ncbi:MAG: hypothetical protein M3Y75_08890 [Actinomycetota bacterium]|nr:hypothetical protein [Actinomycetota bacterium]
MPGKKFILSLVAVVALLGAVPSLAAEQTQETYKEAVEPICKKNKGAEEKLKGARAKVKNGQLDAAAKLFSGAAKALKRTRTEILQVPKPPADAARLTKWLGYVKTEVELFEAVARKLAKDEANAAQKMVVRLISTAKQANNQVLDFEFRYCRFEPSKFI